MIHESAIVHSSARIGLNVDIGPYAIIEKDVEIHDDSSIGSHALIAQGTILERECKIFSHAVIGTMPQDLKYKGEENFITVGEKTVIREFATINRGTGENRGKTVIGKNNYIMSYAHIAHDCQTGRNVIMANSATLAGHITVDDYAILGGLTAFHQFVHVGAYSIIGGGSGVSKDVAPFAMVAGFRAKVYGINKIGLQRHNFPPPSIKKLKQAFKYLFNSSLNTSQATERIQKEIEPCKEVSELLKFIHSSKRGICK